MAELDISQTTTPTVVDDYSVASQTTDGVLDQENFYDNSNFTKWNGNYQKIAKIKMTINASATWVLGLGWTAKPEVEAILNNMIGWGEDSFLSILWNMMVIKKVNGDSYSQIIRDEKTRTLINLKPLDPASIRIVVGKNGIIKEYQQMNRKTGKKIGKPIFPKYHLF